MNISEAREILRKPVFGDPAHIEAKKVLDQDAEMADLRALLDGKRITCWCCEGSRHLTCACGCDDKYHPCHTCKGESKLTLTTPLLVDLHLYQLRDIAKELGLR